MVICSKIINLADELYNPAIVKVVEPFKIDYTKVVYSSMFKTPETVHIMSAVKASLQYCFWYGTSEIRLNKIDSAWVNLMIEDAFNKKNPKEFIIEKLMNSGITLLDERINSINEIFSLDLYEYGQLVNDQKASLEMLGTLPSFKKDPFLKKALYAIMTTYRILGKKCELSVPSDYQIPKILERFGVLQYSKDLERKIKNDVILPEGSKEEVAIRAATVIACEELAVFNNLTISEVDAWLFSQRHLVQTKHHLTITTNY